MKNMGLLVLAVLVSLVLFNKNEYVEIPSTSIRVRVIANSNKSEDQDKKIIIKSAIEKVFKNLLSEVKDYDEADEKIVSNEQLLRQSIDNIIEENKLDTSYKASYGYNYFPEKTYGNVKYKSGLYKSYVVTLGEGEGDNWWCVLYPPICLVDENTDEYNYHFLIKDILEKYN